MLILNRRVGEVVEISVRAGHTLQPGEVIRVTVSSFQGEQTKLGFDAPNHVEIQREEIAERIRAGVQRPTRSGNR